MFPGSSRRITLYHERPMTPCVKSVRRTPRVPLEEVFWNTADPLCGGVAAELREDLAESDCLPAVIQVTLERSDYGG